MHKVFESEGRFYIKDQFQIIIYYSSLISMFLGALVQMLGLSCGVIP